jgi:hypothetical protein
MRIVVELTTLIVAIPKVLVDEYNAATLPVPLLQAPSNVTKHLVIFASAETVTSK